MESPPRSLDSSKTLDDDETASWMSSFGSGDIFDSDSSDSKEFDSDFGTYNYYWQPPYFYDVNAAPLPAYVGAGLANLGNTCFMNAVLQCFIYTTPLLQGFLSCLQSSNCNCESGVFCLMCSLRDLIDLCFRSSDGVVSPYKLVDNLSYFSSGFQRYHQEDAHEFLQSFLDRLESCCEARRYDDSSSQRNNLVKQVFGGRLVSKLKCSSCGHCSDTYEPLIDLSLEIEDADNLVTALQSFTKVEKIEDADTKFTCEGCKEQVFIEKQLALDQIPPVASFHLKRFKTDGCLVEKIDKHVEFPNELDLLPFTRIGNTSNAELKYILYAVVVHSGFTPTSGHYYSMVRLSQDIWCMFDDSRVSVVSEAYVLAQEAYILFYGKEGTSWFSSFIETQNSCPSSTMLSTSPKSILDKAETSSYSSQEKPSIDTTVSDLSGSRHLRVSNNDETKDSGTKLSEKGETSSSLSDLQEKISIDTTTVSDLSGSRDVKIGNDEIKDGGTKLNEIDSNENNDRISNMVEPANVSSDMSLKEDQKVNSPTLLSKTTWTQGTDAVGVINAQTSLKSPSPELIREDPPDVEFSVPHNNLKLVDRKQKLEKEMDDNKETRQACQITAESNSPVSREKNQLLAVESGSKSDGHANIPKTGKKRPLAAVRGSKSEGRTNKKSSTGLSQSRNSPPKSGKKRPVAAVRGSKSEGRANKKSSTGLFSKQK